MALKKGDKAPSFSLESTSGGDFSLSADAAGKPLIVYFFPKDFTPGCTKEACEFRDTFSVFRELDIDVVGISRDDIKTHHEFRKAHKLPFHLLSDPKGEVAEMYKASIPLINFTRRITYLLDRSHHIVAVYENLFAAGNHIKEMVEAVKDPKFIYNQ